MQKFQLYLFDFDGTLFDTLPSSKYVFKKAYENMGYQVNEDDILGFTREPIPDSYKRLGFPKERYHDFIEDINKYVNSQESVNLTDIYDDTYDTIIDLRMSEADLGIVTSNHATHVRDVLKKFDMQKDTVVERYSSVYFGKDELNLPKRIDNIDQTIIVSSNGEVYKVPGYLDIGLIDTMDDLLVNFIGATIFSILGFFYVYRRDEMPFLQNFIPKKRKALRKRQTS